MHHLPLAVDTVSDHSDGDITHNNYVSSQSEASDSPTSASTDGDFQDCNHSVSDQLPTPSTTPLPQRQEASIDLQQKMASCSLEQDENDTAAESTAQDPSKDKQAIVEGFQLVQANGLMDTSTKAPTGSTLPSFATPSPALSHKSTRPTVAPLSETLIPMPKPIQQESNPGGVLSSHSKSAQFNARFDYRVAEFFTRQVEYLVGGTPGALERGYR